MKKKVLSLILALCLTASLLVAGCGSDGAENGNASQSESAAEENNASAQTSGSKWSNGDDYAEVYAAPVVDETATLENIDDFITLCDFTELKDRIYRDDSVDTTNSNELVAKVSGYRVDFDEAYYGCTVLMDYEGKIDDVAFDGGTAQNATLVLGTHSFIDDFEDELVGVKPGEVRDVYVTFPANYQHTDKAGKDAVFTCRVHRVYRDLWDCIISASTVKQIPKDVQMIMADTIRRNYEQSASYYGMDVEQYKQAAGITVSEEISALSQVKWILTNIAVLKACGVTEDSDLYKETVSTLLSLSGYSDMTEAEAANISEKQVHISAQYYAAMTAALTEMGFIS